MCLFFPLLLLDYSCDLSYLLPCFHVHACSGSSITNFTSLSLSKDYPISTVSFSQYPTSHPSRHQQLFKDNRKRSLPSDDVTLHSGGQVRQEYCSWKEVLILGWYGGSLFRYVQPNYKNTKQKL